MIVVNKIDRGKATGLSTTWPLLKYTRIFANIVIFNNNCQSKSKRSHKEIISCNRS